MSITPTDAERVIMLAAVTRALQAELDEANEYIREAGDRHVATMYREHDTWQQWFDEKRKAQDFEVRWRTTRNWNRLLFAIIATHLVVRIAGLI